MVLLCPLAVGQTTPAPTTWQKYPTAAAPSAPLPPPPPLPGTGVGGTSTPGSRVVLFSKPVGEVRPVQMTDPAKKGEEKTDAEKKEEDEKKKDEKNKEDEKAAKKASAVPSDPFALRSDDDLAVELDKIRDYPSRVKDYHKQVGEYDRDLELFKKGELKDENGKLKSEPPKPFKPQPVSEFVLPPAQFQPGVQVKAGYAPARAVLEPAYVVHRRMYFEERNSERYGWDLGFAQPFVSAGYFFKDVLFWPAHLTSNLFERYDTSAGKCPPGSPVAYYLYPPNITLRGGLVETAVVIGTVMLLP